MTKKPDQRYENNYRYTPEQLAKIQKRLYISWPIAFVVSIILVFVFFFIVESIYKVDDPTYLPDWTNTVAIIIVVMGIAGYALLYGAWFGGRSIHRFGPAGTVTAMVGMGIGIAGQTIPNAPLFIVGAILFVLGIIITFYLGFIGKVPMWLQLPIVRSPRLYLNKPDTKKKRR